MKAKTLIGQRIFSKLPALRISALSAKHRHRKLKEIIHKGKSMANENAMNQGPLVPPEAEQKTEQGLKHARKAAEDLRSSAGAMADEYRGRLEEIRDDALHRIRSFQDDGKQYVRENPTKAVFTALAVGFVLGLIFRR
jgi:ElaB/YqjD/DUF883 family membrane-anchored ribosome-binding protein